MSNYFFEHSSEKTLPIVDNMKTEVIRSHDKLVSRGEGTPSLVLFLYLTYLRPVAVCGFRFLKIFSSTLIIRPKNFMKAIVLIDQ